MTHQKNKEERLMSKRLEKWTVLDSTSVLESPWLNVRRDRCRLGNGGILEEYYVQESSDGVVVFAISKEKGEVPLVRQYRHGTGRFHFDLPGGRMGRSDSSPIDTARRELLEETGFEAEEFESIGRLALHPPTCTNYNDVILARNAVQVRQGGGGTDEEIQIKTVLPRQALDWARTGVITCNICVAAIYMACERLGVLREISG